MGIKIDFNRCVGCGACEGACPFGAMKMEGGKAVADMDKCTLCGACVSACPVDAIEIERTAVKKDLSGHKGVWVFAEKRGKDFAGVTFELIGAAKELAGELGTKVSVIALGHDMEECTEELFAYGADEAYVVDRPELADFSDELYCDAAVQIIEKEKPEILLIGATAYGRSLAPRIASRLCTGLTADCTQLEIDRESGLLIQTRPAFGGNIMASIVCPNHRPQMATVRPKVLKIPTPDFAMKGKLIEPDVQIKGEPKVKLVEVIKKAQGANIADAGIIVAAGRGIGKADNIKHVQELADAVGGVVAASRPLVDSGWIDYSAQVGQTGKTVAPKVYFAIGISGAIQHTAGMSSADIIVAVNSDREAPIFEIADYAIVGDAVEVTKELVKAFKGKGR